MTPRRAGRRGGALGLAFFLAVLLVDPAHSALAATDLAMPWLVHVALAEANSVAVAPPDSTAKGIRADSIRVVRVLPPIEVIGTSPGTATAPSAASQGTVTPQQIALRPMLRAGDFLETVPGLLISQHSGEGKANQYYLRGFNLDHGTDFATTVAGVPMSMPSHAHGQGYTDLNFVIPELIAAVQFRKGTYAAEDGDFSSAGSAHVAYRNALPQPLVSVTAGDEGYRRAFGGASRAAGAGTVLGALELEANDGPWIHPDDYRKVNALVRYSAGAPERGLSVTAAGYDGRWNSTDQVPQRAVAEGLISRYGAIDPTDGGTTHRYSLSAEFQDAQPSAMTRASAYLIAYRLDLFSNFTYFLSDTVHGDQFEQHDDRLVAGFHLAHSTSEDLPHGRIVHTVGVDVRHDDIGGLGLYHTEARQRLGTVRADHVLETSLSPYIEGDATWVPGVRTIVGARGEGYLFHDICSYAPLSGDGLDGLVSPKVSLILGPWMGIAVNANAGYGFHSDDVRGAHYTSGAASGATSAPPPVEQAPEHIPVPGGPPLVRSPLLARTRGVEVGARFDPGAGGTLEASLWGLDIDSEHVFQGDAGLSAPNRPSRRSGIELSGDCRLAAGVRVDADFAYSRARFTDQDPVGDHIPGAVEGVAAAGVAYERRAGVFGELRVRYFGPRPLIEDNSVRSQASTVLNAKAGFRAHGAWSVTLEVFNLLDRAASDVDYYYTSRLPGEPIDGISDIHFHPQGPRSFRLAVSMIEPH